MNQKTRDGGDYSSYHLGPGSGIRVLFIRVHMEDAISGAGVQLHSLPCPLQGTLCRTTLLLTVSFSGDACLGLRAAYSNTCTWVSQDSKGERMGHVCQANVLY